MNYLGFFYRSLLTSVILLSMILLVNGCSHRGIHGSSDTERSNKMKSHGEDPGQLASLDELAGENIGDQLGLNNKKNGFDRLSANDGLLAQESLEDDGSGIKTLSPEELAQQYWRQRQQAELMSNRSGLEDVYFELDSWELTDRAKQSLTINAEFLRSNPSNAVTIEGHCDERGTRSYNYVLGEKRALRVRNYLASLGVSPTQLTIMSYGKDNPLCRGISEGCYQENRRAHFLLGIKVADAKSWNDDSEQIN